MPATELTVATRILAHLGTLGDGGRVALRVGSDVAYLCGATVSPTTMTPYDVAAVRVRDALGLAGDVPEDAAAYCVLFRSDPAAVAAARDRAGGLVSAGSLAALVERLAGVGWEEASARVRSVGGLVGAYPAGVEDA